MAARSARTRSRWSSRASTPKAQARAPELLRAEPRPPDIAQWHGGNGQSPVKVNPVKTGKAGWDVNGTLSRKGDSWFSGGKAGVSFKQVVSARAGSTLRVRLRDPPNMHGEIKVLPRG